MPGRVRLRSPTVIASAATTKNQPPNIDIIMFQIAQRRAGAKRQRRSQCGQHARLR
jgi:hypothetical protein